MSYPHPPHSHIPSPPPLDHDRARPHPSDPSDPDSESYKATAITNTLALILPNLSLFHPPILALLRDHFSSFGPLAHWAPVKAFGRVILVYEDEEDAANAKKQGDWLKIDLNEEKANNGGFMSKPIVLRLHPLPPTPLSIDPSTTHLQVPDSARNFLISPPCSPPEGWEPVIEDGPNTDTLAEDLRRALESLQMNGIGGRGRRQTVGPEFILEEGGVRVEVEDTSVIAVGRDGEEDEERAQREGIDEEMREWGEERPLGGAELWRPPSAEGVRAFVHTHRHGSARSGGLGGSDPISGRVLSPDGKIRIIPTAMPPFTPHHPST